VSEHETTGKVIDLMAALKRALAEKPENERLREEAMFSDPLNMTWREAFAKREALLATLTARAETAEREAAQLRTINRAVELRQKRDAFYAGVIHAEQVHLRCSVTPRATVMAWANDRYPSHPDEGTDG
jgi:hypothetical protein